MRMKVIAFSALIFLTFNKHASAGFLDKINAATQRLQQASQQMEQTSQQMQNRSQTSQPSQNAASHELTKTSNPIKGTWGNQITCAGANSATCANGLDDYANCMNQTKGYYYRLVADNLETKLKSGNFSEQEQKDLEVDIASVKDAVDTGRVNDPDPQNPQRWFKHLSKEDQMQINGTNSKYMNEVHTDCESRFGGMSRYSGTGGR